MLERGYEERASLMDAVAITRAFDALHADLRWMQPLVRDAPAP